MPGTMLSSLHSSCSSFNPPNTLRNKYYYCTHGIDKETESQGS